MEILVAKTYQGLPIAEAPYKKNEKLYCKVQTKSGSLKEVRVYSQKEYDKMYPGDVTTPAETGPKWKPHREILGFQKGYITIFKGDTYSELEWFQRSIARYHKIFGWYIVSTDELPNDIPAAVTPVELRWESVGGDNGELFADHVVKAAVEALIYEEGTSEWVGEIGERLDLTLTVVYNRSIDNGYSTAVAHTMQDNAGNVYVWFTSAKNWPEGSVKRIRGTVKDHTVFRNIKQTVLTRCTERS